MGGGVSPTPLVVGLEEHSRQLTRAWGKNVQNALNAEPETLSASTRHAEAQRPKEPLKQTPGPSHGRGRAQVLQIAAGPYHTLDAGI